jgi:hypothetical protein
MQLYDISTTEDLVGMTGSIKSPNYPAAYPDSSDFRWKILTEPGTSIRLLFALFETQEKFDYVFVRIAFRFLKKKMNFNKFTF